MKGRETITGMACGLTNYVRGVVFYEVSEFRDVATVDDPTCLCGLVELFLNFCTELVCGAGLPVRSPVEGV